MVGCGSSVGEPGSLSLVIGLAYELQQSDVKGTSSVATKPLSMNMFVGTVFYYLGEVGKH